ncbi:2-phospho-L-lactate guanylyltransferase [Halostagnicola larsenii XH-48]|uniref:2-phospho-L-lactate guanylyltransferase n=1 Tax=Halostagnicola larsenii XH-48 TaxID=797299 RepID=W0JIN9_9EURY|nr:2-phospho-L-lactate guanylyltransferase [Halostagnicola larsenii]AHF98600.1 2-phospho-L-lactate guanylyltransferase [Halostagnicola larsenii XH-48]
MHVVVPYAPDAPKTRLKPVLSETERSTLARVMLEDVLEAVRETGREPTVLSTEPLEIDAPVTVDRRPLTEAVNAVVRSRTRSTEVKSSGSAAVAVVMADLALTTPEALERLFAPNADVVIAPGRGVGTNALVVRHPEFRVDYHGGSFLDHRRIADDIGATLETVDSFRLGADIDEPADLVEVLAHGTGRTADCLREFGFELDSTEGRLEVVRSVEP